MPPNKWLLAPRLMCSSREDDWVRRSSERKSLGSDLLARTFNLLRGLKEGDRHTVGNFRGVVGANGFSVFGFFRFFLCSIHIQVHDDPLAPLFVRCAGHFQYGEERFLRNIHAANAFHALLALFLFFDELAFARDVAAVTFGEDVFAD